MTPSHFSYPFFNMWEKSIKITQNPSLLQMQQHLYSLIPPKIYIEIMISMILWHSQKIRSIFIKRKKAFKKGWVAKRFIDNKKVLPPFSLFFCSIQVHKSFWGVFEKSLYEMWSFYRQGLQEHARMPIKLIEV